MNLSSIIAQTKKKFFSIKTLVLLVIWIFMTDICVSGFRETVSDLGKRDVAVVLPFLQNSFYFIKTILLGAICFFSDVPFMQQEERYAVVRMGRKKWGWRNIVVIMICGFLLSVLLFFISVVEILPIAGWYGEWGSVYRTFAAVPQAAGADFIINYALIYNYSPLELAFHIIMIDALAFAFMGVTLYALSLYMSRNLAYAIMAGFVFLPSVISKFVWYDSLHYFSPFSWMQTIYWRVGNNAKNPDMVYIYTGYFLLIFIGVIVAQSRVQKIEWKATEDNR